MGAQLNNCTISSNQAPMVSFGGGGVEGGLLNNCTLIGNSALNKGGAADGSLMPCILNNCTVVFNSAGSGGGALNCMAANCILYYNNSANYSSGAFSNCCTFPLPTSGFGNFTNPPSFVNNMNDSHLQSNSPCINAGNNAYVSSPTDLDGNPRIVGGTVDIGAYEYQTPVSMVSYQWLEQYGLPITPNTDTSSPNGTAFDVYQDWIAGLNPTNPASVLAMLPLMPTNNTSGIKVTWQSVSGILYSIHRSTNLSAPFSTLQSNLPGQAGTTSYIDTSATNNTPYFYRVGVP
jgi:hypothetical protein